MTRTPSPSSLVFSAQPFAECSSDAAHSILHCLVDFLPLVFVFFFFFLLFSTFLPSLIFPSANSRTGLAGVRQGLHPWNQLSLSRLPRSECLSALLLHQLLSTLGIITKTWFYILFPIPPVLSSCTELYRNMQGLTKQINNSQTIPAPSSSPSSPHRSSLLSRKKEKGGGVSI